MRKIFLALALCTTLCAGAQNEGRNWYLGADGGIQLFNGYEDKYMDFVDRIQAPTFQVTLGRNIIPGFSLDGNVAMCNMVGLYKYFDYNANFTSQEFYDNESTIAAVENLHIQDGWYVHAYLRAGVDLLNIGKDPQQAKKSHLSPFLGAGFAWGTSSNRGSSSSPTIVYGLNYGYDVCRSCRCYIEANCHSLEDKLEGEMCEIHSLHSVYSLRLGLMFNIGK